MYHGTPSSIVQRRFSCDGTHRELTPHYHNAPNSISPPRRSRPLPDVSFGGLGRADDQTHLPLRCGFRLLIRPRLSLSRIATLGAHSSIQNERLNAQIGGIHGFQLRRPGLGTRGSLASGAGRLCRSESVSGTAGLKTLKPRGSLSPWFLLDAHLAIPTRISRR
jgi:hypothetical protein